MLKWEVMSAYPKSKWVFVWFSDGIEYGLTKEGKLEIGGDLFDVTDALCWCDAPEPSYML